MSLIQSKAIVGNQQSNDRKKKPQYFMFTEEQHIILQSILPKGYSFQVYKLTRY